ncbi:MAG: UDP-N-acetylmuramoyl-L-alanine--D-glutamate ligase [Clostridia bacterium]|nr:UDP-N-acetylmuramoyl-L-alanine--D-glutamate ligase [Clostridia bacterium]
MAFVNEKLNEFNNYLKGRNVAVIGLGVSNIPLIDYLRKYKANVTVFDKRTIEKIDKSIMDKLVDYGMEFSLGDGYLSKLQGFDIIFRSPSCLPTTPELVREAERGAIVTTEIEMVMELAPGKIIGVTGSEGKTTTTTLIYEILKKADIPCYLGGNIGIPLFTKVEEMTPDDVVILELSSFQLMNMKISPNIAVVTNVTPNHLDYHKDYEEYIEAKKAIFLSQKEDDVLILNYDYPITREYAKEAKGKVVFFSSKSKLDDGYIVDEKMVKHCENNLRKHILDGRNMIVPGVHNLENACAAIAATSSFVDESFASKVITSFKGVHHRLELVKESEKKVRWYNDSASSSPTRTIAGLNAYDKKVILIAGGYDKNLDYTPIAKPIVEKAKALILIGQTKGKIIKAVKDELDNQGKVLNIYEASTLEETVLIANDISTPGDIVLFSPASASFDMFKNAYDRGDTFKTLVNKIVK